MKMHNAGWWNQRRCSRRLCEVAVVVVVVVVGVLMQTLNYLWRKKNNQICGFSGA